jgi:hypothetical protein
LDPQPQVLARAQARPDSAAKARVRVRASGWLALALALVLVPRDHHAALACGRKAPCSFDLPICSNLCVFISSPTFLLL